MNTLELISLVIYGSIFPIVWLGWAAFLLDDDMEVTQVEAGGMGFILALLWPISLFGVVCIYIFRFVGCLASKI
jgi:hypothetical protein